MTNPSKYGGFISIIGLLAFLLGLLVVFGWVFQIQFLKSIFPNYATMKFNTALSFSFLGASLYIQLVYTNKYLQLLALLFAFLASLIGALSFLEEICNCDLKIDQLFVLDLDEISISHRFPGRMSPVSALCFTLLGLSLLGIKSKHKQILLVAQVFLHIVTLLSFIALVGYLLNVPVLHKLTFINSVALHTAITFFLLSIAASFINPTLALTDLFTGNRIGNVMARNLFLKMIIAILFLAYIRILSHRYNLVSVEFGIALFAISFILVSLSLVWRTAYLLNDIDAQKIEIESDLSKLKLFLDSTPDAIVIVDEKGIIQLMNNQAENILGYSKDELLGNKVNQLIPERFQEKHQLSINAFFNMPKVRAMSSEMDLFALKKDGTEFPIEISLNPIKMENKVWVSAAIEILH